MSGPLAGVTVLDVTGVVMGPYATQFLGDFGADVIKVEPPDGDMMRTPGPARHPGMGHVFLNTNRNKRSVVLDLKKPQGRAALLRLAESSDVFVYNIRPQAMARLKLGYDDVRAANPKIIYAGGFGFGQNGPYAARAAFDDLIQAMSGTADLLGRTLQGPPRLVPINFCDRVSGLHLVNAILAALFARERTGRGQAIEVPMFEAMTSFVLGEHMGGATFEPAAGPMGYARIVSPNRRPYASRDGFLCILVPIEKHWRALLDVIGRPEILVDPRFASRAARVENMAQMVEVVQAEICKRTNAEWSAALLAADIPHAVVMKIEDLLDDPHLKATGFFSTVEHPSEGRLRQAGIAARFSDTQPAVRRHAPRLGEHSEEVLAQAGYSSEQIATLVELGVTRRP